MCESQVIQRRDNASFSVLGIAIILAFDGLVVLLDASITWVVNRTRPRTPPQMYKKGSWKANDLLELHEAAADGIHRRALSCTIEATDVHEAPNESGKRRPSDRASCILTSEVRHVSRDLILLQNVDIFSHERQLWQRFRHLTFHKTVYEIKALKSRSGMDFTHHNNATDANDSNSSYPKITELEARPWKPSYVANMRISPPGIGETRPQRVVLWRSVTARFVARSWNLLIWIRQDRKPSAESVFIALALEYPIRVDFSGDSLITIFQKLHSVPPWFAEALE